MAKQRKRWVYVPPPPAKPTVPAALQAEVEAKARDLVESTLKPLHVKPPPDDEQFNDIVDLGTKWYRSYFYFIATYRSPGPYALAPSFEAKFARLEYTGANRFSLAWMRHTGQWMERDPDLSLEQCLDAIRTDPFFIP
jgi:hypothetical protein